MTGSGPGAHLGDLNGVGMLPIASTSTRAEAAEALFCASAVHLVRADPPSEAERRDTAHWAPREHGLRSAVRPARTTDGN